MWRRQQPYWHAVFAIVWVAAAVVTLIDDPGPRGRAPSLVLLGLIALAYAVLGTRAMTSRDLRWAVAYQVVAWSALLAIQWVDPSTQAWLLYFTLFPQLWAMVPTRWAAIGTVLVVAAFAFVRWAQTDFATDSLTEILISGMISMGLSLSLGLFINRLVSEAESRAETIDDAAGHPGPACRRRARPGSARGAGAHLARDPRHPRPGLHVRGGAVAGRPGGARTGGCRRGG